VSSGAASTRPEAAAPPVLVLGIGNLLWADEGFGVRCVEALHQRFSLPAHVALVDGGTQGMYLLDHVCDADRVLVLDAVDYKLPPGTLRVFRDADVPHWADTKMSLHQATFQELLSLARLRNRFPDKITLIGVQPDVLDDLGGSLSPKVRARLDEAVALAVAELQAWGVQAVPRDAPPDEGLSPGALALHDYEAGRPSEHDACRIGDARFLVPVPPVRPAAQAAPPGAGVEGAAAAGKVAR
jgi:hydrogenase maturation protease